MIDRALNGYQRCAAIATHYRMNDVLDNIVISLCKFTTLTNSGDSPYVFVPHFGANIKALMATKAVFALAHKHGDIGGYGGKMSHYMEVKDSDYNVLREVIELLNKS